MDDLLKRYIERLHHINDLKRYEECVQELRQDMYNSNYDIELIKTVITKAKYMVNQFSEGSTLESMIKSKENLTFYLEEILQKNQQSDVLRQKYLKGYLCHFYLFLEALKERQPHKKATLKAEYLQEMHINNEYDLQHVLYAAVKPLCPDARTEVTEDTGFGSVRSDIRIPSLDAVIETKYMKASKTVKKLTEEIEADIVHYNAQYIYFFIYDKDKIVEEKQAFEATYNKNFAGKQICTILLQPINM